MLADVAGDGRVTAMKGVDMILRIDPTPPRTMSRVPYRVAATESRRSGRS